MSPSPGFHKRKNPTEVGSSRYLMNLHRFCISLQFVSLFDFCKRFVQCNQNLIDSLVSLYERWFDSYCLSVNQSTCSHYVSSKQSLSYFVADFVCREFHADQHTSAS